MSAVLCRLCRSNLSEPKLKFPDTPLANEFVRKPDPQDLFPLEVCVCEKCGHYQLSVTVEPERLFRDYLFVAGTSPVNVEHFRKYAEYVVNNFYLKSRALVVDVASNDGTLLRHFKGLGMRVLGVDPARNIAEEATRSGIETIPEFFNKSIASRIAIEYGRAALITANNVFAHTSDLEAFLGGIRELLLDEGIFVFEVSYFLDVCERTLFDTIYHEHTSYHTVGPLVSFFKKNGFCLFDVQKIETHGGSIRCFVHKEENQSLHKKRCDDNVKLKEILKREENIDRKVIQLKSNIERLRSDLTTRLVELKLKGRSIAVFGMPAKATTLMYAFDLGQNLIDFVIDDAPLKQGLFTPGKHIPVYPPHVLKDKRPDCLLILAWNFSESIIQKHPEFHGKWIVPIPDLKEVDI